MKPKEVIKTMSKYTCDKCKIRNKEIRDLRKALIGLNGLYKTKCRGESVKLRTFFRIRRLVQKVLGWKKP